MASQGEGWETGVIRRHGPGEAGGDTLAPCGAGRRTRRHGRVRVTRGEARGREEGIKEMRDGGWERGREGS